MSKVVCIDPGHGGKDPGAVGNGLKEKDITLAISKKLGEILELNGIKVIYSRTNDTYLDLPSRAKIANDNNVDVVISIHTNAFTNTSARGIEIWTSKGTTKADELATLVCNELQKAFPNVPFRADYSDGDLDKEEGFYILKYTKAPAILPELGFITNKEDNALQTTKQDDFAIAIAKGVKKFLTGNEFLVINKTLEYKKAVKYGSKGDYVKELQEVLQYLGYYKDKVDGSAGPNTVNAIKEFQRDYNLEVDGSAGPATYKKLNEVLQTGERPVKKYEILRPDKQTTIVKIKKDYIKSIDVIVANTNNGRETLASMQKRTNMDFVINGGLYWTDAKNVSHSLNLLINEGKQVQAGVYSKFALQTFKDNSFKFDYYKWSSNVKDMIGASPSLIINSKIVLDGNLSNDLQNSRHPRTVIGEDKDYFYLITIDGRRASQGLKGMTIEELADYMLSLKLTNAINLDGGGSTKLMYRQEVLNNPCEANRPLNNAVGIKLKEV